jgi:chromosome segregation ATPase
MINTNTKIDQLNLRVDNIDKQLSNLKSEISSLNESSKLDYFQKLETTISKTKEELDNLKNDPNISQNDLDKVLNIEKKYNTLLENFH